MQPNNPSRDVLLADADFIETSMKRASLLSGEDFRVEMRNLSSYVYANSSRIVDALRSPGPDRDGERRAFDILAKGLLAIAERPSWESVSGRERENCRALKPYYDGFDTAALSKAERACDALSHANIVRLFTGEVADRYRALPLAHEEKAG